MCSKFSPHFRVLQRNQKEEFHGQLPDGTYDFTKDAVLLMKAVRELGGRYGLSVPILFLRGSKCSRVREELWKNSLHGKGKEKPEEWWKGLGNSLSLGGKSSNGYLYIPTI